MTVSDGTIPSDWVFGYGSIINNLSRATTGGGEVPTVLCRLKPSFGMVRCWNFRSSTGFTAVGLRRRAEAEPEACICGVLFPSSGSMAAFDQRERGYKRVQLQLSDLEMPDSSVPPLGECCDRNEFEADPDLMKSNDSRRQVVAALRHECVTPNNASQSPISAASRVRLWIYVPLPASCKTPSEDYPICQTYVDTVLQGCLAWGGLSLAREWVETTFDWSSFFLNDAPLSRRPWLHRERHAEIDEVLVQHADWTRFAERRHPEEFASHWMAGLRGMWGVPPRNPDFVGRQLELTRIRSALQKASAGSEGAAGVTTIETVGLGGVGKTQTAIEYCHRNYQAASDECGYGLVVWLQADSADSLAAGFRDLAADSGIVVRDMHNEEIIDEIRSRLYRTGCPWLIVFDNVENMEVLDAYMPRGCFVAGHVLVTSRRTFPSVPIERRVSLDCFSPDESVDFLRRTVGDHVLQESEEGQVAVGRLLADALGHLPLALAMAAGYMHHCDVSCAEYYNSLRASDNAVMFRAFDGTTKLSDYPMGLQESLQLSLQKLSEEEKLAEKSSIQPLSVLNCLCLLAPDGITRTLVQLLVQKRQEEIDLGMMVKKQLCPWPLSLIHGTLEFTTYGPPLTSLIGPLVVLMLALFRIQKHKGRQAIVVPAMICILGLLWRELRQRLIGHKASVSVRHALPDSPSRSNDFYKPRATVPTKRMVRTCSSDKSRAASPRRRSPRSSSTEIDRVWMLLKDFSLLTVRDRVGSMHRLLQQLLRSLQDQEGILRSTSCCVRALRVLWTFDPADTTTWVDAGKLLEHVKAVGKHVDQLLDDAHHAVLVDTTREPKQAHASHSKLIFPEADARVAAELLTEGALYMSMALSRFDEADVALETALRVQRAHLSYKGKATTKIIRLPSLSATSGSVRANADLARILHTRGKVARYRGRLEDAAAYLGEALDAWRLLAKSDEANYWDVASSLHELGVLRLKEHRPDQADALLRESLDMKRTLQARKIAPLSGTTQLQRFSDEAATLHQLAVAAMSAKPSRLDEAEALLQEALALETSGNPFGRGARAASLLQLARVEIRRGLLNAAQAHLLDALNLYQQAYGQDTPHVNVAAVKTQLGKVACSLGLKACGREAEALFGEAESHFLDALRTQQKIYGSNDGDHLEIASTLGQLGVLERARNALSAAERYFERQREIVARLLESTCGIHFREGITLKIHSILDNRTEQLLRRLLGALQWERTIAKDLDKQDRAKSISISVKHVSRVLEERHSPDSVGDSQTIFAKSALHSSDLCVACVECRETVRNALVAGKRANCPVRQEVIDAAANRLATVLASTSVQDDGEDECINGESIALLLFSAATDFRKALQTPGADAFAACDALRIVLRNLEVSGVN